MPESASSKVKGLAVDENVKEHIQRRIEGRVAFAASSRVVEPFFRPFVQRTTIEIPKNFKVLNSFKRYFYHNEPLVGSACELHAEFPMSTFDIIHSDPLLRQEFGGLSEDLNLFDFILDMLLEYWVIGEAFPFGFFDDVKDPHTWRGFVLLNPDNVDIQQSILATGGIEKALYLDWDDNIKAIVNDRGSNPKMKPIYDSIPLDIREAIMRGQQYYLPKEQVVHFKRNAEYHTVRGTSIIERCLKWLFYRDKLREAQYAVADRHVTPKEFYLLGDANKEATQEELINFYNLLQSQWNQPNQAIIWHHALQIHWEGASGRVLPLQPEFQYIDKQLAIALLINEGIVTAERQPYASTSVALDVMIQRYLTLRMRVKRFLVNFIFGTVCKLNDIYKRTPAELKYNIRLDSPEKKLNLPDIRWTKENLRDDLPKLQFILSLVDKGYLTPDYLYTGLDIDPEEVAKKLKTYKKPNAPGQEGIADMGVAPELAPEEAPPEEAGGEEGFPELSSELELEEPTSRAVPPESHEAAELPTGV